MPFNEHPPSLSLPRALSRPPPGWLGRVPSVQRVLLPGERRGMGERLKLSLRRLTAACAGILR